MARPNRSDDLVEREWLLAIMIFAIAGGVLGVVGVFMLLATYMSWPLML
jgi:hypothetical protein